MSAEGKWSREATVAWFNHLSDEELVIVWNFADQFWRRRHDKRVKNERTKFEAADFAVLKLKEAGLL